MIGGTVWVHNAVGKTFFFVLRIYTPVSILKHPQKELELLVGDNFKSAMVPR